jgi:hypothetical protein
MTRRVLACTALLIIALVPFAACGDDGGDNATPTPGASATLPRSTPTAALTPSGDIRTIDLQTQPDVAALIQESGGAYNQNDVLFSDITGDNVDEAIVPLSSGGTLGTVAFIVLTPVGNDTHTLLQLTPEAAAGIVLTVEDGKLVQTEPVYGPTDPECCPSLLEVTTYSWNGAALAIESVNTVENPNSGAKPTTVP